MATLGYTTSGASTDATPANDDFIGSVFTSPEYPIAINSLSWAGYQTSGSVKNFKGVIVLKSNLNITTNGVSNPATFASFSDTFHTAVFSTPPTILPSTEYILGIIPDTTINIHYDAGESNQGQYDDSNSYATPENLASTTQNAQKYSVYVTYGSFVGNIQPHYYKKQGFQ